MQVTSNHSYHPLQISELLEHIYSFLSPRDRFIAGYVCKLWRAISENYGQHYDLERRAAEALGARLLQFCLDKDGISVRYVVLKPENPLYPLRIKEILAVLKANHSAPLISQLRAISTTSYDNHGVISIGKRLIIRGEILHSPKWLLLTTNIPRNTPGQCVAEFEVNCRRGRSVRFDMVWNPKTNKAVVGTECKRGNFKASFQLLIELTAKRYEYRLHSCEFSKRFSLHMQVDYYSIKKAVKRLFGLRGCSWGKIKTKDIVDAENKTLVIKQALQVEIDLYIQHIASRNLSKLTDITTAHDLLTPLYLHADYNGRIHRVSRQQHEGKEKLNTTVVRAVDIRSIAQLAWKALEFPDMRYGDMRTLLRWAVLSATIDLLAKQLGISAEETTEKPYMIGL